MYKEKAIPIQLGNLGLYRDDSTDKIPLGALYDCRNVTLRLGIIEKSLGNARMNVSAVPMGVKSAQWWQPTTVVERFVLAGGDGKVYYYEYPGIQAEITAESGSTDQLLINENTFFLQCGAEEENSERKLFILTGQSQAQVIVGTDITRRGLTAPALDWSGTNQPSAGIVYQNRAILFGNRNRPHTIYISDPNDHEDFQGVNAQQLNIFPGEGERLISCFTYKGRLFFVKSPQGLYYVDISDPTPVNWGIFKSISSFDACSPHSAQEVLDDALICNKSGSLYSLQATLNFGDVANSDLFANMRVETYQQSFCSQAGNATRWIEFYEFRKEVLITYRSIGSSVNDMLCVIDVSKPSTPKVLWHDRMQPNCLGLYRDQTSIVRPFYGSDDGFIYNYDILKDRNINDEAFEGYFTIPALDFGFADPDLAQKNKIFQFLEVTYEPTGRWLLSAETYIDGVYYETVEFTTSYDPVLDDFTLCDDRLSGRIPRSQRVPIHGQGRNISLKFYNEGLNEFFRITSIKVYFKYSGEQQRERDQ